MCCKYMKSLTFSVFVSGGRFYGDEMSLRELFLSLSVSWMEGWTVGRNERIGAADGLVGSRHDCRYE